MALNARYTPEHPSGETASFGMDFSRIIPAGMGISVNSAPKIFTNTQPPVAADSDWTVGAIYARGRSAFAILSGGKPGVDYLLQWTVVDSRNNTWVRSAAVLCAPTS